MQYEFPNELLKLMILSVIMSQRQKHAQDAGAPFAEQTPPVIAWMVVPLPSPQFLGHNTTAA